MSAPTQISDDEAKTAYFKRCMDMSHGQLYAELMRVHKEATALIQQAVEQEREACATICEEFFRRDLSGREFILVVDAVDECAETIRSRGKHEHNT